MTMFAEITRQVRQINDIILSDMKNGQKYESSEDQEIKRHLYVTKNWFIRISMSNKKRFLLVLLGDVRCLLTFSLLLKSIWNCRPKDAVMSVCEQRVWSSYDQVPLDNDRTALPPSTLAEVMMTDRIWFQNLEAEEQAWVLTELVTISGGPIMWEVLKRAQQVYEEHIEQQLQNLQECEVVYEPPPEKKAVPEPVKKDQTPRRKSSVTQGSDSAKSGPIQAQKELESNLSLWVSTVKSMKDSMKLEELEMTFKDGIKKKIWKVNRPKPEVVETVDMIQLVPSSISKRILMYIPPNQLGDCARVNKYWAFLVDEIKAELVARQKIDIEIEKIRDVIMRHDVSLDLMSKSELNSMPTRGTSTQSKIKKNANILERNKYRIYGLPTAGRRARKQPGDFKPIRNMADCTKRLEVRGAADENIWKWCAKVLKRNGKSVSTEDNGNDEGLLALGSAHFPCPLMSRNLKAPSNPPEDPTYKDNVKPKDNILQSEKDTEEGSETHEKEGRQRYGLWSKDFSSLYPVCKVSSHQSPF